MHLGVLTSHPIQYQAPLFRALAQRTDLHVYFAHRQTEAQQAEAGFGVEFDWDVDLLEGYPHTFLENRARRPDVSTFFGCDTPAIHEHVRREAFDVFVLTGWYLKCYWQAVWACRRQGVPVLVRGDSQLRTPRSRVLEWVKEMAYPVLLRAFDGFLSVGQRNAAYLEHYGVPEEAIFPAPHFIDNDWFRKQAAASSRSALRGQIGAGAETTVLLFVGKFVPKKRPADLIRAADVLHERGHPVQAVFVGAGDLEEDLRRLAGRSSAPVHFAGFKNQTELPAYYRAADALVLPSGGETWGLVVNEAMACGTPAVVSDAVGCTPDLVDEGETGASFPVGDVSALADAVERLLPHLGSAEVKKNVQRKLHAYSLDSATAGVVRAARTVST